jgi:hypothetical protein
LVKEILVAPPLNKDAAGSPSFWVSIARIFLVEVLVLVALSAGAIGYVNWSSKVAWAEFLATSKLPAVESDSALRAIKHQTPCDRSA